MVSLGGEGAFPPGSTVHFKTALGASLQAQVVCFDPALKVIFNIVFTCLFQSSMADSDDDVPALPPDTLEILRQFQDEQQKIADGVEVVTEDWQAYVQASMNPDTYSVHLFEYEMHFPKEIPSIIPYDYRHPLAIPEELKGIYDVVIADPPFLADECLLKTAQTVRLLAKPSARILLCTGTIMEDRCEGKYPVASYPVNAALLSIVTDDVEEYLPLWDIEKFLRFYHELCNAKLVFASSVSAGGRGRPFASVENLKLLLIQQNSGSLSTHLWTAVRARGCQFLGPGTFSAHTNIQLDEQSTEHKFDAFNVADRSAVAENRRCVEAMETDVTLDGQRAFIQLRRTLDDVRWRGEDISVLERVVVRPPYTPESAVAVQTKEQISSTSMSKFESSMTDSDDDVPTLPPDTLEILRQFQDEQQKIADGVEVLSQFWYSPETARQLCREVVHAVGGKGRIACISCPTLIQYFSEIEQYDPDSISVSLFEYDARFGKKFPSEYIPYDYRHPLAIPEELKGIYDVVIADPPFLADECLLKTAQTVRLLAKPSARILLCTGTIMEDRAKRLLGLHRLEYEPCHANNLSNEFSCFANYETKYL
ncbi:hypothetical protein OSTOST_05962 [Ostertagia ostertagi]